MVPGALPRPIGEWEPRDTKPSSPATVTSRISSSGSIIVLHGITALLFPHCQNYTHERPHAVLLGSPSAARAAEPSGPWEANSSRDSRARGVASSRSQTRTSVEIAGVDTAGGERVEL
jgi:hypothetical protein